VGAPTLKEFKKLFINDLTGESPHGLWTRLCAEYILGIRVPEFNPKSTTSQELCVEYTTEWEKAREVSLPYVMSIFI
jgi:hypothetical protein